MNTFGNIELFPNEELRLIDYKDCRTGEHVCDNRKYVSNYGRFFSVTNKVTLLKPQVQNAGYYIINVANKWRTVHRIVAHMFIGRTENDIQSKRNEIDHIDGDKSNNRVENLRWLNRQENCSHHNYNSASVPIFCVDKDGKIVNEYRSIREASQSIKGSSQAISECVRGIKKSYKGFYWIKNDTEFENNINELKVKYTTNPLF